MVRSFGVGLLSNFDAIESSMQFAYNSFFCCIYDGLIMGENEYAISLIAAVASLIRLTDCPLIARRLGVLTLFGQFFVF